MSARIVLTTIGTSADTEALARTLVEEGLAACVNILPAMRSVYRWQGAIHHDDERQLVIKTTDDKLTALELRVKALHPYELPEWLVVNAEAGVRYFEWLSGGV